MSRKRPLSFKLSNWEIAEIYVQARRGVSVCALAETYGVSHTTIVCRIRDFEQAAREHGYKVNPIELSYDGVKEYTLAHYPRKKEKTLPRIATQESLLAD